MRGRGVQADCSPRSGGVRDIHLHGAWQPREDARRDDPEQRQVWDDPAIDSGRSQASTGVDEEAGPTKQDVRLIQKIFLENISNRRMEEE